MRRFTRWLYIILIAAPITLLLGVVNVRLYYTAYTPDHSDVVPQLAFIKEQLLTGTGEEMQGFFPEGYFFLLYALWVSVGRCGAARYGSTG